MAKIKPVRVNLSTKPEEIIATMREEIDGEDYQFQKQYGGRKKYMKYEDQMVDDALINRQSLYTDLNEHISKVGNRWITYTHVQYYPEALYAQAYHFSFIYYETYGSCGAFFPMYDPDKSKNRKKNGSGIPTGVVIFTSHFFLRMSERTGKAYRSKELIQEFISTKNDGAFQADEDGDVIVKFKGGYGFGKEKSKNPNVIEIRTFLTDAQLTPAQRRKVEKLDAYSELVGDGMTNREVALGAAYHTYNTVEKAAAKGRRNLKAIKKLGLEKPMAMMAALQMCFVRILEDLLHMELSMAQIVLVGQLMQDCGAEEIVFRYASPKGNKATEEENERLREDMIVLFSKVAKKMELQYVNRETITEYLDKLISSQFNEQKEV